METLYVAILVVQLASGGDASWVVDENLTADDCAYVQADWETGDKDVEVICRPQWEE